MASTDKTTNLGLPQWAANDPVERKDFNDCFSTIDGNIGRKKLLDYTVAEKTNTIQLDFKSINLEPFAELWFYFKIGSNGIGMRFNNYSGNVYMNMATNTENTTSNNKIQLFPRTAQLIIGRDNYYVSSAMTGWLYVVSKGHISRINTVELFYEGSNTFFNPGDRVSVWGVFR